MRVFTLPLQATERDIDSNGHVNNIVYVQWMQEIAIAHSGAAGCTALTSAAGGTWVARSHRIEYLRPAYAGDRILRTIYCSPKSKSRGLAPALRAETPSGAQARTTLSTLTL